MPFIVHGITGAVDGLSFEEGFSLIALDASGLSATENERAGNEAWVTLSGVLVERIDPATYEAAFRSRAREQGEALDRALLDQTLALIGQGRYELRVEQRVRVVRQSDGVWRVCEELATP
jgi:hypothetical protein